MQWRHSKLYCLCNRDIQNFIVCAVATFKTLLFVQSRHSKLYCLCSRDIQNFIVCAVATFKTLLFVQWRHSKLYCLCSRDIQNFIVCAVETFKTLLFVQSRHSKLYCLCSRAIRNFLVCVSLLGLRNKQPSTTGTKNKYSSRPSALIARIINLAKIGRCRFKLYCKLNQSVYKFRVKLSHVPDQIICVNNIA